MTDTNHNCTRNPFTGACYVCNAPMQSSFPTLLERAATQDTTQAQPKALCVTCKATTPMQGAAQCLDCWLAEQTAPRPIQAQRKQPKQPKAMGAVSLDSILEAMERGSKWSN